MKKRIILLASLFLLVKFGFAQDVHFSQYFVAPQFINPAAFGVFNSFEAGLQYKGQWNGFTNGYTSYAAFANKSFRPKGKANSHKAYVAMGLNVLYDKAGDGQLTNFKAELPVNVTKRVGDASFLTAGLSVGYGQLSLNTNNFTWGNQFDGYQYDPTMSSREISGALTQGYVDATAGFAYTIYRKEKTFTDITSPKNIFGFSVAHLNRPVYAFMSSGTDADRLRMRWNFYEYHHIYFKNSDISLVPSLLFQYQGGSHEIVFGTFIRKIYRTTSQITGFRTSTYVSLGFFYRMQDAFALNLMLELKNYSIGLNYDFNLSKLNTASRGMGGLELSLKVNDAFRYLYKGYGKY